MISFASDNWAPVHPRVLQAIAEANQGPAPAYGKDEWTQKAAALFKREFGPNATAFPVLTGTAANVLSVASISSPHRSLLCADTAHLHVHECGATERFVGCKLKTLPAPHGKLNPDLLRPFVRNMAPHESAVAAVSITQATELGTVYSLDELRAIATFCHENGWYLHMDGARLANAAVHLGVSLKALTADVGVDVLSFGATKNGLMGADAVVFFDSKLALDFGCTQLQRLNLASKLRFVSAQLVEYLKGGLWRKNAENANAMAQRLYRNLLDVPSVKVIQDVEANLIFATFPPAVVVEMQKKYSFYELDPQKHEVRLVTSWDTTEEQVDDFSDALKKATLA